MLHAVALLALQEPSIATHPEDAFHRTATFAATSAARVEVTLDFEGTLHVWAPIEVRGSMLRVDPGGDLPVLEDDGLGGRRSAYLELPVREGETFALELVLPDGQEAEVELHWVESRERRQARAASAFAFSRLRVIGNAVAEGGIETAQRILQGALRELVDVREPSHSVSEAAWRIGDEARRIDDLETCRAAWKITLAERERVLPADHPDLLRARAGRAWLLREEGELAEAAELYRAVFEAFDRFLPRHHPDPLAVREELAETLVRMDDLDGARRHYEAVLHGLERTRGEGDPDLRRVQGSLARALRRLGDLEGARTLEAAARGDR